MTENSEKKYPASLFDFEKRPLSYSGLKPMLISPLHFAHNRMNPKAPTDAMIFGNVLDCLLLTPEDFDTLYIVADKPNMAASKKNAVQIEAYLKLVESVRIENEKIESKWLRKNVIDSSMKKEAEILKEKILASKRFQRLYEATTSVQKSYAFTDKKTGFKVIAKFDAVAEIDGKAIVWDLKSTVDASKEDYPKQAVNMDYPLQGGTYLTAYLHNTGKFADFYHVVAEKTEPYGVNVFRAPNDWIEKGKQDLRLCLDRVKFCMDHDCFDMGFEYINVESDTLLYDELFLPGWAKRKE